MRFVEFRDTQRKPLVEAARIQHAEDFIFWDGSAGAVRVLNSLEKLEQGVSDVTLKWDGSPSIIFGRNEDGGFVLTDKSGFVAKGYDGKATSGDALQKMLMARPGANNPDTEKAEAFAQFAGNMKDIFDEYEKAVPKDFRGFFKGDLLYYNTPELKDDSYVFTPQIVTYTVKADSPMGKRIGASKTGVVIHRMIDENGLEGPLPQGVVDTFVGNEVFVVPPVTVQKTAEIDNTSINELKQTISQYANAVDEMLNQSTLQQLQLSDFSNILYAYTNSKVDTGMGNMGQDFMQWLSNRKQVSEKKKARIAEYIQTHKAGFDAVWALHTKIMQVKDDVIRQFDQHDSEVKQEIGPHGPVKQDAHGQGGEGYVLAHPEGDIKLVPREYFSKANRAVER